MRGHDDDDDDDDHDDHDDHDDDDCIGNAIVFIRH